MLIKIYVILLVIFLGFLLQVKAQENNLNNNVIQSREDKSVKDLIKLITYRQIKEQWDGEYVKGDWDFVMHSKPPKYAYWSYPTGVTMYAMQRAYDILKDDKILDYISKYNTIAANQYQYLRWQKYKFGTIYKTQGLGKLWRLRMLDDSGAMGVEILESVMHHNAVVSPALQELIDIIGNYVTVVQARLDDGTFWRPKSPNSPTIWADDLYMGVPFLVKWSEYKNDESFLTDAALQIINFASYLQDKKDGIWFHGYYVNEQKTNCCKWGRGNGWVAVAIAEVLTELPKNHHEYKRVLDIYKKQVEGLQKYQAADGLWNQVVDHPELSFGTETSCSAQFVYSIARGINKGWIDKSFIHVVDKAVKGLKSRITREGGINKVCKSTSIEDNLEYYNNRPTREDDHHGNGLMLFALTEVYHLFENK